MSDGQEYLREFIVESREGLDRIDNVLIALEGSAADRKQLDIVYRALHTIKGNAGFMELPRLGTIAHAGEALLSRLVAGKLSYTAEISDSLLRLVDAIRRTFDALESTGDEGTFDHDSLIRELAELTSEAVDELSSPGMDQNKDLSKPSSPMVTPLSPDPPSAESEAARMQFTVLSDPEFPSPATMAPQSGESSKSVPKSSDPKAETPPPSPQASNPSPPAGTKTEDSGSVPDIEINPAGEPPLSNFIRVQIGHLDELMNLVGELVLTRNRIVQIASNRPDDELTEPIQRLDRLTAALQDGVLRTRMQPVRNAWKKYPRIVRDLAKKCGKQCELELQGGDTELDKSMLEAIADPLVHLVRNAIDHGIEKPYLRRIKGKPETGRLLVRSFQESGQVHIEVSDDGAGLDLERIRRKAVEVGVLSPENAMLISESELRNSVFLPGFTTADQVTDLSGRGVGMDVVKTSIEQIGGTIELQTQKDVGTTIRLTVPLTLAIIPAIMVHCGQQWLAIPQLNVVEMLRLQTDEDRQSCDYYHDTPVLRLRGELLPMANLSVKLGLGTPADITAQNILHILVLKAGTRRFALLVDEIGDPQEIVVKPLGELLSSQSEYSGVALMGDGSIALILDVLGIARTAGLLAIDSGMRSDVVSITAAVPQLDQQVLVCEIDHDRQIALSLGDVVCLEQVSPGMIESSAHGGVLQYRGGILSLQHLSRNPHTSADSAQSKQISIVVYRTSKAQVGLIVDRIVDVAPRPTELQPVELTAATTSRGRVIARAVVLGRVTDFLEVN